MRTVLVVVLVLAGCSSSKQPASNTPNEAAVRSIDAAVVTDAEVVNDAEIDASPPILNRRLAHA